MGVSVIICCYNSERRISETLSYLNNQVLSHDDWEVIIVDNNCSDNTINLILNSINGFRNLKNRLKIVEEKRPGLSYARMTGVALSSFDIVLFCDDDNWLNENYLSRVQYFLDNNSEYGILGGNGVPICEINPPKWFKFLQSVYATGCRSNFDVDNVYGAGMAIRKNLILDFVFLLSDRKGDTLASGGDAEICFHILNKGYKIKQLCDNFFMHFIPKERLTKSYILRMGKAYGETNAQLFLMKNDKMYGVLYRLRKDLVILIRRFFTFNIVFFQFELRRRFYYWVNRFDSTQNCMYKLPQK